MSVLVQGAVAVEADNSLWWCEHFRRNAGRQRTIPWEDVLTLTDDQRRALLPSLQDFQLGESSEGRHGRARAAAYASRIGDPHYAEAVRLFFAEENRHAGYLACYLGLHGVRPIGRSWTDFVFRRVRRLMGLELLLTVLLTAELIGEVYYRAVRAATACPVLRAVCAQLLRDERMHVRFHVERFRFLRRGRSRVRTMLLDGLWQCFFVATCLAVWHKHGRALRLGGYGFRRFRAEALRGLRRVVRACR
jgi:hypothetical protein